MLKVKYTIELVSLAEKNAVLAGLAKVIVDKTNILDKSSRVGRWQELKYRHLAGRIHRLELLYRRIKETTGKQYDTTTRNTPND